MAFIQTMESEENSEEVFMVSYSVGANAANWWTDIQLVQYLIGCIYIFAKEGNPEWTQNMSTSEINDLPDPNKDFKKLTKTANLILRFQKDVNKQSLFTVSADSQVDRARGVTSSISKTTYTILVANYYFASVVRNPLGFENWQEWALNDQDMPAMLKGQLLTNIEI